MNIWIKQALYYPKFGLTIASGFLGFGSVLMGIFDLLDAYWDVFIEGSVKTMFQQTIWFTYIWVIALCFVIFALAYFIPSEPKNIWS